MSDSWGKVERKPDRLTPDGRLNPANPNKQTPVSAS